MDPKVFCYFFALLMATNSFSYAQKETVKFGKVSDQEMNMTVYDKDTSAPAIVLYDYGINGHKL